MFFEVQIDKIRLLRVSVRSKGAVFLQPCRASLARERWVEGGMELPARTITKWESDSLWLWVGYQCLGSTLIGTVLGKAHGVQSLAVLLDKEINSWFNFWLVTIVGVTFQKTLKALPGFFSV